MKKEQKSNKRRQRTVNRVRKKVYGTAEKPRLAVFRSGKHIGAQLINDDLGVTVAAVSTASKALKSEIKNGATQEAATKVGSLLAGKAKEAGVENAVFDRRWYKYHGRIKALAEAAREGGLVL